MAWLGARRQLLPAEMRPRGNGRVGRCFSVAAVHVANLFIPDQLRIETPVSTYIFGLEHR